VPSYLFSRNGVLSTSVFPGECVEKARAFVAHGGEIDSIAAGKMSRLFTILVFRSRTAFPSDCKK